MQSHCVIIYATVQLQIKSLFFFFFFQFHDVLKFGDIGQVGLQIRSNFCNCLNIQTAAFDSATRMHKQVNFVTTSSMLCPYMEYQNMLHSTLRDHRPKIRSAKYREENKEIWYAVVLGTGLNTFSQGCSDYQ